MQQGGKQKKDAKATKNRHNTGGKDIPFIKAAVQTKADHGVGNSNGDNGNKKVGGLHNDINNAVIVGGKNTGIQGHEQKNQKLGAKGAQPHDKCI